MLLYDFSDVSSANPLRRRKKVMPISVIQPMRLLQPLQRQKVLDISTVSLQILQLREGNAFTDRALTAFRKSIYKRTQFA
jgi:hypothetical protein